MPKIQLSPDELVMITDTTWILAKQRIIKKVYELFAVVAEDFKLALTVSDPFPTGISQQSAKISKGENYLSLPYVMLDYPSAFSKTGICAVRTMFWWGNFFSITLHL